MTQELCRNSTSNAGKAQPGAEVVILQLSSIAELLNLSCIFTTCFSPLELWFDARMVQRYLGLHALCVVSVDSEKLDDL